jgi:hypothetical protein
MWCRSRVEPPSLPYFRIKVLQMSRRLLLPVEALATAGLLSRDRYATTGTRSAACWHSAARWRESSAANRWATRTTSPPSIHGTRDRPLIHRAAREHPIRRVTRLDELAGGLGRPARA